MDSEPDTICETCGRVVLLPDFASCADSLSSEAEDSSPPAAKKKKKPRKQPMNPKLLHFVAVRKAVKAAMVSAVPGACVCAYTYTLPFAHYLHLLRACSDPV